MEGEQQEDSTFIRSFGLKSSPPASRFIWQCITSGLKNQPYPEVYTEKADDLWGAKSTYRPTVLRSAIPEEEEDQTTVLSNQLYKTFSGKGTFHEEVYDCLQKLDRRRRGSVWMSYTLSQDLNLPIEQEMMRGLQVFYLAPGQPPFVLAFFGEGETKEETEHQTRILGQTLTSILLCYCYCDFLLLPCCLSPEEFSLETLKDKLKEKKRMGRRYFGAPMDLTEPYYRALKRATIPCSNASLIPPLLVDNASGVDMVLMDPGWRDVLSLLLETVTFTGILGSGDPLRYPETCKLKFRVAVLETAVRLSFASVVWVVVTSSPWLEDFIRDMVGRVEKDLGLKLKMSVICSPNVVLLEDPRYIIDLNWPSWKMGGGGGSFKIEGWTNSPPETFLPPSSTRV